MPVFNNEYEALTLNDTCLTDPLLMALAWKKAHDYIRTTNWYADNFELDVSSIDLPSRCNEWVKEIQGELKFKPLELIPAPKSHPWEFVDPEDPFRLAEYKLIWQPAKEDKSKTENNEKEDPLKLRPLAHIGIREQAIMTLVMMCLANDVESAQGDPATDYAEVHKKGIVSYGNRLYCRYDNEKAEHSYGATTTYSKYFTDYRRFLQRPHYFARKELPEKSEDEEVYLVELDLSRFFDCIDRRALNRKICDLANSQEQFENTGYTIRDNILTAFERWQWSPNAKKEFGELFASKKAPKPPVGLPQGLVASGFLANIYMADFDDFMNNLINGEMGIPELPGDSIKLVDYCRYVDDMRLVLVGPCRASFDNQSHLKIIKKALLREIEPELKNLNLEINEEKTKVEIFRGKSVGISKTLEDIQSNVSGPVSYDDAEMHLGQLESILDLSSGNTHEQADNAGRFNRLAAIEQNIFDVREDTLKRFATNKISGLLNNIRHFTSRDTDENGYAIPLAPSHKSAGR